MSKFRYPKKSKKLPTILERKEVKNILNKCTNRKYQTMLSLACTSGLRVGELIRIKVRDINLDELTLTVRQSKGKKDRVAVISYKLINSLSSYISHKESK